MSDSVLDPAMRPPVHVLFGHGYAHDGAFGRAWIENWLARLRAAGFTVHPVQIGLDVPGRRLPWHELNARWRRGDRELLEMYERVARLAANFDVLINSGGLNLHPEFLAQLPTFNVLHFNDDPESSRFSRPVAAAHDLCAIGNIAELATYRSWGVREVVWAPMGFRQDDYDPALTYDEVLHRERPTDVALLCERLTVRRRRRLDRFAAAFPQGVYRGPGWPAGFLPERERVPLLRRTKIGVNIHQSTGPINFRTYYLPANGVLQICDNRAHLGQIYELDREVVGYDTIDEAIELCRYYLAHDEERRAIAAAGWRRAVQDYNEVAVFARLMNDIGQRLSSGRPRPRREAVLLVAHRRRETAWRRALYGSAAPLRWPVNLARRGIPGLARRALRVFYDVAYLLETRVWRRAAQKP